MIEISLFGSYQVCLNGELIKLFPTIKAQALLAYLAVEAGQAHRREVLAGLFWPEQPEEAARISLRQAIFQIRQIFPSGYLLATRNEVQFNPQSDFRLDTADFESSIVACRTHPHSSLSTCNLCLTRLEQAVDLYRGDFLAHFYLADCQVFEAWALLKREWFRREALQALAVLSDHSIQSAEGETAHRYAWRQVELDPLREEAYRQLMYSLVLQGQRSGALTQYDTLKRILNDELGVQPTEETENLVQRIRSGDLEQEIRRTRPIRGYEILEQIGAGSFGVVYRAYQPVVEREVAVKVILPQYANEQKFIRRFDFEAQLVARLEHPHIVPIYDFWREPGGAYLVMRFLRGGSLADSLKTGAWQITEVIRLLDQVSSALDAAHRTGIIHRDLKPANILLDEAGNAYLSDFGIAKDITSQVEESQHGSLRGSPHYVSPEQLQGLTVSPQTDLYSLGIILFELLTGQHPFKGESYADLIDKHLNDVSPILRFFRPDLPLDLDHIIQKATAKDPAERYADVLDLVYDFRQVFDLEIKPQTAALLEEQPLVAPNPYKGLQAFQEADANDFFGREFLTQQLISRLGEVGQYSRFLAVVGSSGSGKSSVVNAGLLPALRKGALPGSQDWFVVEILPGSHPLEELEIGLFKIASTQPSGILTQLREDDRGLLRAARRVLPEGNELFLVIDQFEEIYTLVEDIDEANHFLDLLYTAVSDSHSSIRVLITLRADFFDRPLIHPNFSALMEDRTVVVVPLSSKELERAIREPAERVGATFEEGLVTAIVTDVLDQPGALPLLQYSLTELYEHRQGRLITHEAYEAIGGVSGALGRRAEEIYLGLDGAGNSASRQMFLRLVTLGEGVEDTRRRALYSELVSLQLDPQEQSAVVRVLYDFEKARLLSFDHDLLTRTPTIEVAHEALLREWPRLRQWLDESRADLRMQRVLSNAAADWIQAERELSFLLRGARLEQFDAWTASTGLALTQDERSYLQASLAEREAQRAAETARRVHEAALERKSRNFLRVLAGIFAIAALVSLFLFGAARQAQRTAQRERDLAQARELTATTVNNLLNKGDPELSILTALQSMQLSYTPDAETTLRQALLALRKVRVIKGHSDLVIGLDYSPDGTRLVSISLDGTAKIWDVNSGQELLELTGDDGGLPAVAFSPDGARVATLWRRDTVRIWDAVTGQELLQLPATFDWSASLAFSPDGSLLATTTGDGLTLLWDSDSGELFSTLTGHTDAAWDVAFSPDGKHVVSTSADRTAIIWDISSEQQVHTITSVAIPFTESVFNPDGSSLALTAGSEIHIFNAKTGSELLTIAGTGQTVAYSPDGKRLATGLREGEVKVFDASTGEELLSLPGVSSMADFSPDGKHLASNGEAGSAVIWDISPEGGREVLSVANPEGMTGRISVSPDGKSFVTTNWDGTVQVWDFASGRELRKIQAHNGAVWDAEYSPDGSRLVTAGEDTLVRMWDLATVKELFKLQGHADLPDYTVGGYFNGVLEATYSPDGSLIASAGEDGSVKIWDAASGEPLQSLQGHPKNIGLTNVKFSPDGTLLAATTGSPEPALTLWHISRTSAVKFYQSTNLSDTQYWALAISAYDEDPPSQYLTVGDDNWVKEGGVFQVLSVGPQIQILRTLQDQPGSAIAAVYNNDGSTLVTASTSGEVKIRDGKSGDVLKTILTGHKFLRDIALSPDGRYLLAAGWDGTARIFVLETEDLISLAKSRLTRWFTPVECEQYLHTTTCPTAPEGLATSP